jgi:outer membrane receptor protein involved in Fe transport
MGTSLAAAEEAHLDVALRWGLIAFENGEFVIRGQDPLQPVQPLDTVIPPPQFDTPVQPLDTTIGGLPSGSSFADISELFEQALDITSTATNVESVSVAEARILGATDTGSILTQSSNVQTVNVQRRSSIALDPYVRGYRYDQINVTADGALWPARRDLDSMISKIDPSLITDMAVFPGPYGLRYGPGFAYIAAVTADTPRYCNGYESHLRTGFTFRHNGSQMYGRMTAYGGGADYGYILGWGIRDGADYRPGEDAEFSHIPSSYNSQNFNAQLGFDLSSDASVEIRYQRVDQTDTEFGSQFFDINALATDALSITLSEEDPCCSVKSTVNAWYNFTRFNGNTDSTIPRFAGNPAVLRKRGAFPVIDRVERALDDLVNIPAGTTDLFGNTWGDFTSTGIRASRRYGDLEERHFRLGADVRYIENQLNERYGLFDVNTGQTNPAFGAPNPFDTNMPRADMIAPGMFAEYSVPWLSYLTSAVGARLDFTHTRAREDELRANTSIAGGAANFAGKNHQNDTLYALYLSNELQMSPSTQVTFGVGHGQRAPSLVDRYADSIFLGFMQSGFNRVIGEPTLEKESAWQIDLGVDVDCGWYGWSANVYHSWIDNYNLYQGEIVVDPFGARLLRATNAELVTIYGFEGAAEMDFTDRIAAFGSVRWVEGRDKDIQIQGMPGTIDQSLYGIIPMEGRVGFRLTDDCGGDTWGVELGSRIVDNQNQVGWLRQGSTVVSGLVPLELPTPGFTTFYVRGYWNASQNLNIIGGIDNLFDKSYVEHLDLRLPAQTTDINNNPLAAGDPRTVFTRVLSPGLTPYVGVEYTY